MNLNSIALTLLTVLSVMNQSIRASITADDQRKQAEIAFRERYKNLNIPPFTFNPEHSYHHDDGTGTVFRDSLVNIGDRIVDFIDGTIGFQKAIQDILKYKASRYEPTINSEPSIEHFKLLHEKGHNDLAQKGLTTINRSKINAGIAASTLILWGNHKNNIFTKLGSKGIAAAVITTAMHTATERFHEVYADNYACAHVKDKEELEKVERDLMNKIAQSNKELNELGVPLILGKLIDFCLDPYHPSRTSRLTKIQNTINTRFSKM